MDTIIRAPRGEARRVVKVSDVEIPDLWHVAAHLDNDAKDDEAHNRMTRAAALHKAADDVREVWHLAHDLLENVRTDGKL